MKEFSKQELLDRRYLKMASIWAENSHAIRRKVGALLVKDGMIISDGYNGTPSGFENDCEFLSCSCKWTQGCCKIAQPISEVMSMPHCTGCEYAQYETKPYVLHAEANAITKVSKCGNSSEGATLYVTCSPCLECSKLIIQAGIKRVVYRDLYRVRAGLDLLLRSGIELVHIENPNDYEDR